MKVKNCRVGERCALEGPLGVSLPALAQSKANLKATDTLLSLVVDGPMARDPLCLSGPSAQLSHSWAAITSFYQIGISHVTIVHL